MKYTRIRGMDALTRELGGSKNYQKEKSGKNLLIEQEWIDVNGVGGYASNTVLNCNTRKYHGLLTAAMKDTPDRYVLLSKFDETLSVGDKNFSLAFHYYKPGVFIPLNEEEILSQTFENSNQKVWTYKNEDFLFTKELQMLYGENTTLMKFTYRAKNKAMPTAKLNLKPLLAYKCFHANSHENQSVRHSYFLENDKKVSFTPYETSPTISFSFDKTIKLESLNTWYRNFSFKNEEARGYEFDEDLACPAQFDVELQSGESVYLVISSENKNYEPQLTWERETRRREELAKSLGRKNTIKGLFSGSKKFIEKLTLAGQDFVISPKWSKAEQEDEYSIIAGYHWFGEWGRDTMIALPGLLLETGRVDVYKKILRRFLNYENQGLIPNLIGDTPAYNSIDASLWLFWAVQQLEDELGTKEWIKQEFWNDLKKIFNEYRQSNTEKLRYREDGLLDSGTPEDSLTWMDACLDGQSVIQRRGAIVEINALWYNAVCYVEELANDFNDSIATTAKEIKERIEKSFTETFYLAEEKHLADFVNENGINKQLRPNQLLAVSLPYSPIDDEVAQEIVTVCTEKLLTPFGMRTLSPDDENYKGRYEGDTHSRDRAYHNGTVWPWLLGPYGEALLKVSQKKSPAKRLIKEIIQNLQGHLEESGINSISEIFDGDAPFEARGCIAQAWSVSELRRLAMLVA